MTIRSVIPHLIVDGATKAMEFYAQAFGAVPGQSMAMPDSDKIIHADMTIGDHIIYLVDEMNADDEEDGVMRSPRQAKGTTVAIALIVDSTDAVYAQAVKAGATEHMPPADTFWGARYAQILDPWGHLWELNQPVEQRSEPEMQAALAADIAAQEGRPQGG